MTISLDDSYAWCTSLSRRMARNFYFSFLTLPADKFRDMCVLYAFMRISDDLGDDERVPIEQRAEQLSHWREILGRALDANQCDHVVLPALVEVVRKHRIPHEYFYTVVDGVQADLRPDGFETFDELAEYCYKVAGVVGLCCIHVWGFRDERAVGRAVDCGIAFQLTNILRDLGEDISRGRVYLPREDLERFGYTAEDIASHRRNERFEQLMRFEIKRAKVYYGRAEELFDYLDASGRAVFSAMLGIYGGLLDEIERNGYDVYSRRVRIPRWRKLLIVLRAMARFRWFAKRSLEKDQDCDPIE